MPPRLSGAERALLVETNKEQLKRALDKIRRQSFKGLMSEFQKWGILTIGQLKGERLSGRLPDDEGLNVVTGDLRRSFRWTVHGKELADAVGRFTSRSRYAAIHEFGGSIHQTRGSTPVTIRIPPRMGFRELLGGRDGKSGAVARFVAKMSKTYQRLFNRMGAGGEHT